METLKTIGIIFGSIYLTTGLWLLTADPNFHYTINLSKNQTTIIVNQIKKENKQLSTPQFKINNRVYNLPDTVEVDSNFKFLSDFNIFNNKDSTFFHIYISGNNKNEKTFLRVNAIGNMGDKTKRNDPYPRHILAFRQNAILKNKFNKIFLEKLQLKLDSISALTNKKIKVKRTIW